MSRFRVRTIDEPALASFGQELRHALAADDRKRLAVLCESEDAVASWLGRCVDVFLVAASHEPARTLRDAVRAAALARAARASSELESKVIDELARNVASDAPERVARPLLRLLDETRAPFFLRDPEHTLGMLARAERVDLVSAIGGLDIGALDELIDALRGLDGAALLERV